MDCADNNNNHDKNYSNNSNNRKKSVDMTDFNFQEYRKKKDSYLSRMLIPIIPFPMMMMNEVNGLKVFFPCQTNVYKFDRAIMNRQSRTLPGVNTINHLQTYP